MDQTIVDGVSRDPHPVMKPQRRPSVGAQAPFNLWLLAFAILISATPRVVAEAKGNTLVVSHVYNGYSRANLAGGGFKSETYVFAKGGLFDEAGVAGDTVTAVDFNHVARTVASALETQSYLSSTDPEKVDLMIMVWYGTTKSLKGAVKPPWFQDVRSQNTRILGFAKEQSRADSLAFTSFAADFYDELYSDRYFVVLKAYDFQVARKEKRMKLLWESRFSIRRQAVDFVAELPAMSRFAALTFGRETGGVFDPDSLKTDVKMGELKVLDDGKP